ncbi:hypothetical protein GCM10009801_39390 [Streptomyces albiaxialis]|uniref:Transferase n=2 Tax=Streptomyces albiaxialis TaxID=329523 RepID=A0ABN2W1V4_9ACTN
MEFSAVEPPAAESATAETPPTEARTPERAPGPRTPEPRAAEPRTPEPRAAEPRAAGARAPAPTDAEPRAAAGRAKKPAQRGPRADCTADIAGGLTFDVRLPASPGPAGDLADAALLLRSRPGKSGVSETVRLPLVPVEEDPGTLRAALPSTVQLGEGRWNAFLVLDGGEPRRLVPGVNDLRSLVDRTPRADRTWLGVRIPYATKHGNLSVRSWLRWPHAEAGALRVMDGGLVLCGRLYGAELAETARLEARARRGGGAAPVLAEVAAEGAEFTAVLPYHGLAGHPLWDLWLRPAEDAEAVRIARILDDVPDKKRIFTYPAQPLDPGIAPAEGRTATATPYYTLNNDLAVRVDHPY